jgi:hypothetical protein
MRKFIFLSSLLLLWLLLVPLAALQASQNFTKNNGQLIGTDGLSRPDVMYYSRGKGPAVFLRQDAISYVFTSKAGPIVTPGTNGSPAQIVDTASLKAYRIDMELIDAHVGNPISEENQQALYSNFYLAHCPNGITEVPDFEKIIYKDIYDGIDMACYYVNGDFKYDFIVHPGADPNQIRMRFVGGEVYLEDNGTLKIVSNYGTLEQALPATYEDDGSGKQHPIGNTYGLEENGTVFFKVDSYNSAYTLVIDPLVFNSETYISSTLDTSLDEGLSLDHDAGNIQYKLTKNLELYLPVTPGLLTYRAGSTDYAISSSSWLTYYGGSANEAWFSDKAFSRLRIDNNGKVVIYGTTASLDLPLANAHQTTASTTFLARFSNLGNLDWATYYGSGAAAFSTYISGMAFDASNNLYVAGGYTAAGSAANLTNVNTANPLAYSQPAKSGGSDAFIARFDAAGNWEWGTLFGGTGDEAGTFLNASVVVTNENEVILAGTTNGTDIPNISPIALQQTNNQDVVMFLTKFKQLRNRLDFVNTGSTFLGGTGSRTMLMDMTKDADDNIFLTGIINGNNLPGTNSSSFQQYFSGSAYEDAFIMKLRTDLCSLFKIYWATYYGSTGTERTTAIRSINNRLYVTGETNSAAFPVSGSPFTKTPQGDFDGFAVAFEPNTGNRFWAL